MGPSPTPHEAANTLSRHHSPKRDGNDRGYGAIGRWSQPAATSRVGVREKKTFEWGWRPIPILLHSVLFPLLQLAKSNQKPEGKATNSLDFWGIEQGRDNGGWIWSINRKYPAQNLCVLFYSEKNMERWVLSFTAKSQGWKLTIHFIRLTWNDHTHTNSTGHHPAMKVHDEINAKTKKNVMANLSEHDTV